MSDTFIKWFVIFTTAPVVFQTLWWLREHFPRHPAANVLLVPSAENWDKKVPVAEESK